MDFEEAKRLLAALEREGVRYIVVGAIAMAAHGLIRATRDLDLFVAPDPDNVARLRGALRSLFGDDPSIDQITAEDLAGEYPAIEYTPPHGLYSLDILSRLGKAFRFDELQSEELVLEGMRVRVATPRMLYLMKRDTIRAQDRLDAEALRQRFGLAEEP